MEVWKDIPNYEGLYQASSLGRIRTCENKVTSNARYSTRVWKSRIMKGRGDAEIIADNLVQIPLRVWCPFNDTMSVWVDVLISLKKAVMDRIKSFNLRFCLILPFQWLNDGIPLEYGHQLMFFRQRMYFNTPQGCLNKPRANCFVLSDGLLKRKLTFIDKKKRGEISG